MRQPTREEINVHDSLDERSACTNFLGKSLDEAESLFRESFLYYQEDLMWMGPEAFRFYVPAALRYLRGESSKGDSDAISSFVGLLKFRWEHEPKELQPIASELAAALNYIVENHKNFDDDIFELDADLLSRCEQLIHQFQKQI